MQHHEFSPSKLERLSLCPGSYNLGRGLPDVESEYAEIGTKLHKAMENGDITGLTEFQIDLVHYALEKEAEALSGYVPPKKTLSETKLSVFNNFGQEITSGTADKIYLWSNSAILIDYKFGFMPVPPSSMQLLTYATGIIQLYDVDYVDIIVIQPNNKTFADHIYRFGSECAKNVVSNIEIIISNAENKFAPTIQNEFCKYCPAISICPQSLKQFEIAKSSNVIFSELTDLQLVEKIEQSKIVEQYIKELEKELEKRIKKNGECANYVFIEKVGNREVSDTKAVFSLLQDYFSADEFLNLCKLSITSLEKEAIEKIKTKFEFKTKKEAKEVFNNLIGNFINIGKSKVSIGVKNET